MSIHARDLFVAHSETLLTRAGAGIAMHNAILLVAYEYSSGSSEGHTATVPSVSRSAAGTEHLVQYSTRRSAFLPQALYGYTQ
jgi:hypothetical protein